MANNLIFPIGFDLEKGVKDAIKDWNDKRASAAITPPWNIPNPPVRNSCQPHIR